jgi:hypothetical protein
MLRGGEQYKYQETVSKKMIERLLMRNKKKYGTNQLNPSRRSTKPLKLKKFAAIMFVASFLASLVLFSINMIVYSSSAEDAEILYNPTQVLKFHVQLSESNWQTIRHDDTFDIEVPCYFWVENIDPPMEDPIYVSIRRKSATALGDKISFKIDINEYEGEHPDAVDKWMGVKKLSLENGDDTNTLAEGLAWQMHKEAAAILSEMGIYYYPGRAAWVSITLHRESGGSITDTPLGVYVNQEQVDKQFLKNRGMWISDETWLIKKDDRGPVEFKESPDDLEEPSPTQVTLNEYYPFITEFGKAKKREMSSAPQAPTELLDELINMDEMLTLGAVNAFSTNPDELFNKDKNAFYVDYHPDIALKRTYFPWDLDAVIRKTNTDIYESGQAKKPGPYQETILNDPVFRERYNNIMNELVHEGSMFVPNLKAILDAVEGELVPLYEADPNNNLGDSPSESFDQLRVWLDERILNVRSQLEAE